jgi:hypothetical protein
VADNIAHLHAGVGSYLATIDLYRDPTGEIRAVLQHMPVPVIESEATISARLFKTGQWAIEAGLDLMRQGVRFDHETREAQNDG